MRRALAVGAIVLAGCSTASLSGAETPDALPTIDGSGIHSLLAAADRPAVVNVWASWCLPCRSEAPLLAAANRKFEDEVAFIGIAVQDDEDRALEFIAEFGLDFDHYFDRNRAVPAELGGIGVPITYFVGADGMVVNTHSGIIDERTLALMLDELTG